MNAPLALLLCAAAGILLLAAAVFTIAAIAAPRGITSGPAVDVARGLFASMMLLLLVLVLAFAWGIGTGWR